MIRLQRLGMIVAAYALASAASGLTVSLVLGSPMIAPFITALIAIYASLPALVAIVLGEWRGLRRVAYYAAVGAAIGVGLPIFTLGARDGWLLPITGLLFGPVAGWIYWRVAGRKAGIAPHAIESLGIE